MKKWIAIDLFLVCLTGLLAWQLHNSVLSYKQKNNLSQFRPVKNPKQKVVQATVPAGLAKPGLVSPVEFSVIADRNVFSEARSRDDKVEVPAVAEVPPLLQKPILVGVTISDNQKSAFIIVPGAAPQNPMQMQAQNRRSQRVGIGDVYQGYTITTITEDHIVLESGTRKEVIPLHEGSKRPQGGKTAILSTRVISFGAGSTISNTPVAVSGGGVAVSRGQGVAQVTTGAPATAPSGNRGATGQAAQAAAPGAQAAQPLQQLIQQIQQGIQQGMQQLQQPPNRGNGQGNRGGGGNNTIRTPFGDMARPNQ
jgi:hypothetical protein